MSTLHQQPDHRESLPVSPESLPEPPIPTDYTVAIHNAKRKTAIRTVSPCRNSICRCNHMATPSGRRVGAALDNWLIEGSLTPSPTRPGQMVVRMGVGYDNVNIKVAGEMGIPVANVPNYGTEEVRALTFLYSSRYNVALDLR